MTLDQAIRGGGLADAIERFGDGQTLRQMQPELMATYGLTEIDAFQLAQLGYNARRAGQSITEGADGAIEQSRPSPVVPGVEPGVEEVGVRIRYTDGETGRRQETYVVVERVPAMDWEEFVALVESVAQSQLDDSPGIEPLGWEDPDVVWSVKGL